MLAPNGEQAKHERKGTVEMTDEQLIKLLRMLEAIRLGIKASTLVELASYPGVDQEGHDRAVQEVAELNGRAQGLSEIALKK